MWKQANGKNSARPWAFLLMRRRNAFWKSSGEMWRKSLWMWWFPCCTAHGARTARFRGFWRWRRFPMWGAACWHLPFLWIRYTRRWLRRRQGFRRQSIFGCIRTTLGKRERKFSTMWRKSWAIPALWSPPMRAPLWAFPRRKTESSFPRHWTLRQAMTEKSLSLVMSMMFRWQRQMRMDIMTRWHCWFGTYLRMFWKQMIVWNLRSWLGVCVSPRRVYLQDLIILRYFQSQKLHLMNISVLQTMKWEICFTITNWIRIMKQ